MDVVDGHADEVGDFGEEEAAADGVHVLAGVAGGFHGGGDEAKELSDGFLFGGEVLGGVELFGEAVPLIGHGVGGVVDDFLKCLSTIFHAEVAGVFAVGDGGEFDVEGAADEDFEGAFGGAETGVVGVKDEDDGLGEVFKGAGVIGGEGGTEGGDDVGDAGLVAGDDVHIAFDNDGGAGADDLLAGEVEAVDGFGFVEEAGFGGVEIFGFEDVAIFVALFDEDAAAEGDDAATTGGAAGGIDDGEDDAVAEDVIGGAVLAFFDEAGVGEVVGFEGEAHGGVGESGPGIRGEAEAEFGEGFVGESAGVEVVEAGFSFGGAEMFFEEGAGPFVGLGDLFADGGAFIWLPPPAASPTRAWEFGERDLRHAGRACGGLRHWTSCGIL